MKLAPAPIALLGYNRPRHIEMCIASLQANGGASDTILYCFIDGPRGSDDRPSVEAVRRVVRGATGFLRVEVVEREGNLGLSRNVIDGVTRVLAEHESVIVVEDDLAVSPVFLAYMRQALDLYRPCPAVFSVAGYNFPRKIMPLPRKYPYDAFFVMRNMCWGWGTWRDRWRKADWDVSGYHSLSEDPSWRRSFREGGSDLPHMLDEQMKGRIDSWAIRWTYAHFANHAVCLVPVDSLVNNLGADDSGRHMKASARYVHRTLNTRSGMRLPPLVYVDPVIARRFSTSGRSLAFRALRRLYWALRGMRG